MKSKKLLTTMTLAFGVFGGLLLLLDTRHADGVFGGIGIASIFLGFLCFVGLLIAITIGSLREK